VSPSPSSIQSGYPDVDALVAWLGREIPEALGSNLVALWLTGSLTYGDFDYGSSDIDYCAVIERELSSPEGEALVALHDAIGADFPVWRERIEGTYVTRAMLASRTPPPQGRPYVNGGQFWDPDPPYGNEWLLNLHVLRGCGVALYGPEPEELIGEIDISDVRAASARDLFDERLPEADNAAAFEDSHIQAYVTLTLCRILHRAFNDDVASKRAAAAWVKARYGEPWRSLVERAERWHHGQELGANAETRAFVRFVADELCGSQSDRRAAP
jgi:hypothetical protein